MNTWSGKKWLQKHGRLLYYGGVISLVVYAILLTILLVPILDRVDDPSVVLVVATLLIPVFGIIIFIGSRAVGSISLQKVLKDYSVVKHGIETDNQYIMKTSKLRTLPILFMLVVILVPLSKPPSEFDYHLVGYIFLVGTVLFVLYYTALGTSLTLNREKITVRTPFSLRSCKWEDINRFEVGRDPRAEYPRKLVYVVFNNSYSGWLGDGIIPEIPILHWFRKPYEKAIADTYGRSAEELAMLLNLLRQYFSGERNESGIKWIGA